MPMFKRTAARFASPCVVAAILATAVSVSTATIGAQQNSMVQTGQAQISGTVTDRQVTDLYGPGSYTDIVKLPPGTIVGWKDYDPKGDLREDSVIHYTTAPSGTSQKTEETRDYYSEHGAIEAKTITDWNLSGGLSSYRLTDYDFRGTRIFDHISKYELNDHIDSNWNPHSYGWDTTTIPYKLPATPGGAAKPGASATNYDLPQNQSIGMLLGRDYKFGDTISGSLWKANYAEAFKTVPGLYEYSFPMQAYTLPDKSLSYAGLEIGVKGYGYEPLGADGSFSLHLPYDYKGSLQFQLRQDDVPTGSLGTTAQIPVDPPTAAPALPQKLVDPKDVDFATAMQLEYLIELWNYAYDLEGEWDEADFWGASDAYMDDLEWEQGDVYEEIDYVTSHLPKDLVVGLAQQMADETRANIDEVRSNTTGLTDEEIAKIHEDSGWAEFLDDEAHYAKNGPMMYGLGEWQAYWDTPVLPQGRLGAVRGPFTGNLFDDQVHLDGVHITPIAETPNSYYFMPPDGLTAGLNNFQIGGYGTPETTLPVFYMTLTMWADATNLHKGQQTTYHLKLSGLNGLPGSAWSSSFYQSDLIGPSDLQGGAPPNSSRKGTITLTITNQTPSVITMKNVYTELNAQSFVPAGTFQFDGGVGAIMDGSFGIVGIARAFLQPEWAWGSAFPDSLTSPTTPSLGQTFGLTPSWLGPSSIAPAGLPACSLSNGCLDYDPLRIYRQFNLSPNSASSAAATENPPAPTRDEVQTSVTDAQQTVKDWTDRCKDANKKASAAWAAGTATVPQHLVDTLTQAGEAQDKAGVAERSARNAYSANPTDANLAAYQSAMATNANAREAYDAARSAVEDQFSSALRTAFQAADNDAKTADYYRARAEEELRDAHNTAGQFKPMLDIKYLF